MPDLICGHCGARFATLAAWDTHRRTSPGAGGCDPIGAALRAERGRRRAARPMPDNVKAMLRARARARKARPRRP